MKRLLAIATAFTMTAVMLAGCGSNTQDSASNTSAASEPAAQESVQPEAAESTAAETGEAAG